MSCVILLGGIRFCDEVHPAALFADRLPFHHLHHVMLGSDSNNSNNIFGLNFVDRDFDARDYELLLQLDESVPNRNVAYDSGLSTTIETELIKNEQEVERYAICLCDKEVNTSVKELSCGHSFHPDCIDKWLKEYNNTCPICKQSLSDSYEKKQPSNSQELDKKAQAMLEQKIANINSTERRLGKRGRSEMMPNAPSSSASNNQHTIDIVIPHDESDSDSNSSRGFTVSVHFIDGICDCNLRQVLHSPVDLQILTGTLSTED